MKMINRAGQELYFNEATKNNQTVYILKAITPGMTIPDRDKKPHRSRTFKQLHQAEKWLERNGYKCKDK